MGRVSLPAAGALAWLLAGGPARAQEPTTSDCLLANESSVALRNDHKLRAARGQVTVCASASCPAEVRAECERRVDEIGAAMPTIVFEAKDAAGADLTGVHVTVDGQPFVDHLDGTALPIDPGEHVFVFDALGRVPVHRIFVVREGEKDRHEHILIAEPLPGSVADMPPATAAPEPAPSLPVLGVGHGEPSVVGSQRIAALAMAGVGVIGVAAGSAFGLQSMSKHDEAARTCPDRCTTGEGVSTWHDAVVAGNVSTVAFALGGAALVGSVVLWLTGEPATASRAPAVGVAPGGVTVRGSW
jgi:hypothetical protein